MTYLRWHVLGLLPISGIIALLVWRRPVGVVLVGVVVGVGHGESTKMEYGIESDL